MLSTKEKISFSVLLGLVILPEIIWQPISTQMYNIYVGYVLHTGAYVNLWKTNFYEIVLFIQFMGTFVLFLLTFKKSKVTGRKIFFIATTLFLILSLISFFAWLMVYAMAHVTITTGLP